MKAASPSAKKLPKNDREQAVLFGLIDLYIKTAKPIGSQTLQENGFESLSSATIRNYFSKLEKLELLTQQHTSGGRVPTAKGLKLYAEHYKNRGTLEASHSQALESAFKGKEKEIASLIHRSAETLSELSRCAIFISMPRFDQDFIQNVRLFLLEKTRLLSVVITDFGLVRTESVFVDQEIDEDFLKKCESYFLWRLSKGEQVLFDTESETKIAQRLYNELMVRHVVGYLNFPTEEIHRCGVSRLLAYPEFSDATAVVSSLSLLEDGEKMRSLLRTCCNNGELTYWIGDDLELEKTSGTASGAIAIPYQINQSIVGAVALLGPMRLPYQELFGLLRRFSELLTTKLTESVYKFKISYRQPSHGQREQIASDHSEVRSILLEDQREDYDRFN